MKIYTGTRTWGGCEVLVNGIRPLNPRLDLWNHSPTGFEWGYGGSGPAQLALALLADNFDADAAVKHHQRFKFEVVAGLPREGWQLTSEQVRAWMAARLTSTDAPDEPIEVPGASS